MMSLSEAVPVDDYVTKLIRLVDEDPNDATSEWAVAMRVAAIARRDVLDLSTLALPPRLPFLSMLQHVRHLVLDSAQLRGLDFLADLDLLSLSLQYTGQTAIANEVIAQQHLEHLNLAHNKITSVTSRIIKLGALRTLVPPH